MKMHSARKTHILLRKRALTILATAHCRCKDAWSHVRVPEQKCACCITGGVWGLDSFQQGHFSSGLLILIAAAKLVAISVTVLAGFRGGFIFPIFLAGTAFGRGLAQVAPVVSLPLFVRACLQSMGNRFEIQFTSKSEHA